MGRERVEFRLLLYILQGDEIGDVYIVAHMKFMTI